MLRALFLSLLILTSPLLGEGVVLNMIVKNEAHVIRRGLDSVKDLIDYWVIVDTGSTDGTQEIIKEHMKDIPGELHERPWKNFGHNRTEALELAKEKGDYLLFLDADDWFTYDEGFEFGALTEPAYTVRWSHQGGSFSYERIQLIRTDLPWRWEGVLHNYLVCEKTYYKTTPLNELTYVYGGDGARSKDPEKFLKNANILLEALEEEPENQRYQFYLGESYRDAGLREKAIEAYEKRVLMGGWDQEVFWSLLQIAALKQKLRHPLEEVAKAYEKAHLYRFHRAEPVYCLAEIYNWQKNYSRAYALIKGWQASPKPLKKDVLFGYDWIKNYGVDYQLSVAAYFMGLEAEANAICNRLIASSEVPENFKAKVKANQKYFPAMPEKRVLIAFVAKSQAPLLPSFLEAIEQLHYDKNNIDLFVACNKSRDDSAAILEAWAQKGVGSYHSIFFEAQRDLKNGEFREKAWRHAEKLGADALLLIDCDVFLDASTLKELVLANKPIVAPLLGCLSDRSRFNFLAKEKELNRRVVNREQLGEFSVDEVSKAVLIDLGAKESTSFITNRSDFGSFLGSPQKGRLVKETLKKRGELTRFDPKRKLQRQVFFQLEHLVQKAISKGEIESARSICQEGLRHVDDPLLEVQLGVACAQLQEALEEPSDAVISWYHKVLERDPQNREAYYYLSDYYRRMGEWESAKRMALEGLKLADSSGWIAAYGLRFQLALAHIALGNAEEAKMIAQTLKNEPFFPKNFARKLETSLAQ